MRKIILVAALIGAAILPGCKKSAQNNATQDIKSVNDIKIPTGFSWENSHNVAFTVSVTDTRFGNALHGISIYDGDPNNGGNLLSSGSASTNKAYTNTLYIPNTLTNVYVVKTSPDNSRITYTSNVAGATAAVSFGATDPTVEQKRDHRESARTTVDCSSGCTNTITTSTSNVNVNTGDVICITGNSITVSFSSVNAGTIRVCGSNVTLQNLSLNGPVSLIITSSGSANISSLNFNSSSASIENDGTLNGTFTIAGNFINNGTFTTSGDLNLNSPAVFTNNGTTTVNGNFTNSASAVAINSGTMLVTSSFTQNAGGGFTNNCACTVNGGCTFNAPIKNYNLMKILGFTTLNSGGTVNMYNTAMFEATSIMMNNPFIGSGSTSLVKITGAVTINSGAYFNGNLQVSSVNTINASNLTGGATLGNSLYIPVSSCNSDGNGTAAVADADGDGVPDNVDAYPNDATKAYNSYYPSSGGAATVAFEDQWPAKGDYDLNDVVMGYKYMIVTNTSNNVVQVIGNYTLTATGGSANNGFAVQFPTASANVSGLTGGSLQSCQTNAVVTIFTNMRAEMSQWNTVPGATQAPVKTYSISFNVANGSSISTFGLNSYNPFIWNITGHEVHLPGHLPTSTADQSVFGTQDDNTSVSASRYYLTKTGLPYAIDVPVAFSYPVEGVDITQAYLNFGAWAQSSSSTYTDWFSNTASGYRNAANIYTR